MRWGLREGAAAWTAFVGVLAACSSSSSSGGSSVPGSDGTGVTAFGEEHAGDYSLGPVEWEGSYHNSCAPYPADLEAAAGPYLAGVGLTFNGGGQLCDACILVKTRMGKQLVAKVITTGVTKGPNDIDLSTAAYNAIYVQDPQGTSEHPRPMTWQLAKCPMPGNIAYQFQTGANTYWTSLWVRNIKLPVTKLEVKSAHHADWAELQRGGDGTLTDGSGFGDGSFSLRVTASDGQQIVDTFPSFTPGGVLQGGSQFQ